LTTSIYNYIVADNQNSDELPPGDQLTANPATGAGNLRGQVPIIVVASADLLAAASADFMPVIAQLNELDIHKLEALRDGNPPRLFGLNPPENCSQVEFDRLMPSFAKAQIMIREAADNQQKSNTRIGIDLIKAGLSIIWASLTRGFWA